MNLQAEKLELVKMIIDTDDKNVISEINSFLEKRSKVTKNLDDLEEFYEGFKNGIHEVKLSLQGEVELKDANTWLNEL